MSAQTFAHFGSVELDRLLQRQDALGAKLPRNHRHSAEFAAKGGHDASLASHFHQSTGPGGGHYGEGFAWIDTKVSGTRIED